MKSLFYEVLFTRIHARLLILLTSLLTAVFALVGPFFQKEFIDHLSGTQSQLALIQFENPLWYVIGAFVSIIIAQFLGQATNFLSIRESLIMQQIFAKRVYNKTLQLRVDTMSGKPVGEIVALYATDVPGATVFLDQTLPAGASTLFPLILAPFAISLMFDIPLWPTVFVMLAIIACNSYLAFRQSVFFFQFKQLAAERIGLVSEWIQNIRTIRILGWTRFFEKNIFLKREEETKNRIQMVTNGQFMNSISSSITFLLNLVALSSLIFYSDHKFTSGELLALLWIVAIFLTRPFRQMPWFFTFAFDSWTSIKRLEKFLYTKNNQTEGLSTDQEHHSSIRDLALKVSSLNLEISKKKILNEINFEITEGEFVAVVGEVGAGKSMLLLSLLGETGADFRSYNIGNKNALLESPDELRSHFSYVPQEGFIMSASLRENVAFLYDVETDRDAMIEDALRLAQFDMDSERVENGLDTEIGERGVNLSGGQRQRVGLARVHYHQARIMLLDDCLSALDVDTEQKLFDQLLMGAWKSRTRILVTHRLSALPRVDRILFMEKGQIIDEGTFNELLARNEKFRTYTKSVAQEHVDRAQESSNV
jgi:ATP-binding cassette subfamily B multidrug efflux pump